MEKSESKMDWGLLLFRLFFIGLIPHGIMKLMNVSGTAMFFGHLGIPFAWFFAYVEPLVEVFGSLVLVFGVETLVSGILVGISMLVAVLAAVVPMAASKGSLWSLNGIGTVLGLEAAYVFLAFGLVLTGPGRLSLKHMMGMKG